MPKYKVNDAAVQHARSLIDDGKVDTETEWSKAAPAPDDENEVIDKDGYDGFGRWHLGIEKGASEETKGRFGFLSPAEPVGELRRGDATQRLPSQRCPGSGAEAEEDEKSPLELDQGRCL